MDLYSFVHCPPRFSLPRCQSDLCYFCAFWSNRQHTSPFSEEIQKTIPGACSTLSANKFSLCCFVSLFTLVLFTMEMVTSLSAFPLSHINPFLTPIFTSYKWLKRNHHIQLAGGMQCAVPPLYSHDVTITRSCTGSYPTPEC